MKVKIKSYNWLLSDNLTLGKEYKVNTIADGGYYITFDNGVKHFILLENCSHLNDGSWEIVDEN